MCAGARSVGACYPAPVPTPTSLVVKLLLVACLIWHALAVMSAWRDTLRDTSARDFASYYYAEKVALAGGDPYDKAQLADAAQDDGTRRGVHPFFYPPPYLLTMVWVQPLSLVTAYRAWFWADELFALLSMWVLWRWWRPLGPSVGVAIAGLIALMTAWPNNHEMGQMNWPVVLIVLLGLREVERGRDGLGGALVGLACMMKMSPALFVAWWLLHRRWRPAAAAVATAVVLSVAALAVVPFGIQLRFFTEVLPAFSSGRYNGLGVGINLFGNHSIPNLFDGMYPAGPAHLVLSDTARALSQGTALLVVGLLGWALRSRPSDELTLAGQVGAITAAMLLIPVITYEHHLVWLIPAAVASVAGIASKRLHVAWAVPVALAIGVACFDLAVLKRQSLALTDTNLVLSVLIRELKFASIVVLWLSCLRLVRSAGASASA